MKLEIFSWMGGSKVDTRVDGTLHEQSILLSMSKAQLDLLVVFATVGRTD